MTLIPMSTSIYFYHDAAWVRCYDVLQEPGPVWEYGMGGAGPMDLVADTGILTFTLDNSDEHVPNAGAVQLLTNGGFETAGGGGADVFGTWVEDVGDGAIADEGTLVHGGSHAAKLTAGATAATAMYHAGIVTVPGVSYQLTLWTRGDGTNGGRYQIYDVVNGAFLAGPAAATGITGTTYTQMSFPFTAPAGCTSIMLYVICPAVNGGIAYFDDVSVKQLRSAGYYTPGHALCPTWFTDGMPVLVVVSRTDGAPAWAYKFYGYMTGTRPSSGMYRSDTTEVEARDWMDYAATQKIGLIAIQSGAGLGVDDVLTAAVANFPKQPPALDFDVGNESFPVIFNTDDATNMTMMSLFQKYAKNECGGFIFVEGDGTLRFDNRHARMLNVTDSFTLDATADTPMTELEVGWSRDLVANRIEVTLRPAQADTGANTVLWALEDGFAISPAEVIEMDLPFRDPATGDAISATNVVDPLVSSTHIKFGSADDGVSNDLIASLTFPITVGGNSAHIVLTNIGAVPGYLNKLEILGDGYYTYEKMVLLTEDAASIALRGPRPMSIELEQIVQPTTAKLMGDYLLGRLKDVTQTVKQIRFLANSDSDIATGVLALEPNTRFKIVEPQTGVNGSFYACRLRFEQVGALLWVEIVPAPAGGVANYFIWDEADHGWDEGVWVF